MAHRGGCQAASGTKRLIYYTSRWLLVGLRLRLIEIMEDKK